MIKKCAGVFQNEYVEWDEDEGPAHPMLQDDKEKEMKHQIPKSSNIVIPTSHSIRSVDEVGVAPRGMRIA